MSLLLGAFPKLPWMGINPEKCKAATLPLPFPRQHHWVSTMEAGAGPGMREVIAGATSSHQGKPLWGESSQFCLQFDSFPSAARHWLFPAWGFVLSWLLRMGMLEMQWWVGGSGSGWQQVVLCIWGCHRRLGTKHCCPQYKAPWEECLHLGNLPCVVL